MDLINDDIWRQIFCQIDARQLLNLSAVCGSFAGLAPPVWKHHVDTYTDLSICFRPKRHEDYRKIYRVHEFLKRFTSPGAAIRSAAACNYSNILSILLSFGYDPNEIDDQAGVGFTQVGSFALQLAAQAAHIDAMKVLIDGDADPNCIDQNGRSALMIAAAHGHTDCVRMLLEAKADVNLTSDIGQFNALHFACNGSRHATIRLLIQSKADLSAVDNEGRTALMVALRRAPSKVSYNLAATPLVEGDEIIYERCLRARNKADQALERSLRCCAASLILAKADINVVDNIGRTAESTLRKAGRDDIANWLLDFAAQA